MNCVLGVDIGTTHCKAGLVGGDGSLLSVESRPTPVFRDTEGYPWHDPDDLWQATTSAIRGVIRGDMPSLVCVTSMAEAGLLVDRESGKARTRIIPWWDRRAAEQMDRIAAGEDARRMFRRSGLHPSYKYGLPKIVWLRDRDPDILSGAVWLSVADYVVYRLTGAMRTDPTLAARTYVFDIAAQAWDAGWIRHLGLSPDLFPDVLASGIPAGSVTTRATLETGLPEGIPAAIAGHDHICALPAVGILSPGPVLDSVGTAESLLGVLPQGILPSVLEERGFESGLAIVPHVEPGHYCWLGGVSASGGSVEWLKGILGDPALSYEAIQALVTEAGDEPTGIFYFPYLSGRGAPHPDSMARAAFVGLSADHGRADIAKAVLEGTAYEAESIRRAAEHLTGERIDQLIVVGGGARNAPWVQIKADISGCTCVLPALSQATVLGAVLTGAANCGMLSPECDIPVRPSGHGREDRTVTPHPERRDCYRHLYDTRYVRLGEALRAS